MKPEDKDKLNECLKILDTTDLGLSMVWLWTWSTIKNFMEDEQMKFKLNEDEVWDELNEAVKSGYTFTLEYGAEQHHDDVQEWLFNKDIMVDMMFEEEEEETNADD
jgi:hypothetical protein